ncbi:MAG: hypothetical protein M8357_13975 [Desulfobulbaceae bacterium]|nr:hypothetical protein [Desulfobulbaceae bacterium]
MNDSKNGKNVSSKSTLSISAKGLKGRQSVRATFRLPEHIINLLGIVAAQLGIKQKSLFDQLVEDRDVLTKVAEKAPDIVHEQKKKRQKTFVLSRKSLDVLDSVARQQKIPRDFLVEISIERLLPVINSEQEKHKKRKLIYKDMEAYLHQGKKLLRKTERLLGKEDQVSLKLRKIVNTCEANASELASTIEDGRAMEDFVAIKQ